MESRFSKNSVFKDYKGNYYRILCVSRHSVSEEKIITYQELYGKLEKLSGSYGYMFLETVENTEEKLVPRFTYVAHLDQTPEILEKVSIPSFTTRSVSSSTSREREDDVEWAFSAEQFRSIEKDTIDDSMVPDLFGSPPRALLDIDAFL